MYVKVQQYQRTYMEALKLVFQMSSVLRFSDALKRTKFSVFGNVVMLGMVDLAFQDGIIVLILQIFVQDDVKIENVNHEYVLNPKLVCKDVHGDEM